MEYLFNKENANEFELFGKLKGHAFWGADKFARANISYLETLSETSEHKLSTCHTSDLIYYIIEGEGEFCVDKKIFKVKSGESVLVPKETEYGYIGKMKYVLFLTPAFTEGCETRTERSLNEYR